VAGSAGPGDLAGEGAGGVVRVRVLELRAGESPRLEGEDRAHVARLAELESGLPPILVERGSMRVVDGMHRLLAASLRGEEFVDVVFFEGSRADAFVRAVQANVAHGLPLSLADRRAAAARIVGSHGHWSDRAIGEVTGLAARTVAGIRRRSSEQVAQLNVRVGRDGRVRPVSGVAGRERAAAFLAEWPGASLREVARGAGVSPATARDVRARLARGDDPVPGRRVVAGAAVVAAGSGSGGGPGAGVSGAAGAVAAAPAGTAPAGAAGAGAAGAAGAGAAGAAGAGRGVVPVPGAVVEKLLRDPSLRHNEHGRWLLRLLQVNAVGAAEWRQVVAAVPPHCAVMVGQLARAYAQMWLGLAHELEQRTRIIEPRARLRANS
jgi:hypothetical protein